MKIRFVRRLSIAAVFLACAQAAIGQTFTSGSTGADSAFELLANQTLEITVRDGGVYHYTTFRVHPGATLIYRRGADNSPVVILATGDVTINGTIDLPGRPGSNQAPPGGVGGPGGFSGGNGNSSSGPSTAGHGPGGGGIGIEFVAGGQCGAYGASSSLERLIPLFGGSGGGGGMAGSGVAGGGGGGAILIASSTRITHTGLLRANGGGGGSGQSVPANGGGGSGGAIRLVAPQITGTGAIQALSGCGTTPVANKGRIRLEAFDFKAFLGTVDPTPTTAIAPGPVSPASNPALTNAPTLAITKVGGITVPSTPATGNYFAPDMTLPAGTSGPVLVELAATNTPVDATTTISVRVVAAHAATLGSFNAFEHTGTFASSTAKVNATLQTGVVSTVQAIAAMTLGGQTASLFPLIDGEPVDRVLLAATPGQASELSLVTKSGREVPLHRLAPEDQTRVSRAWSGLQMTRAE